MDIENRFYTVRPRRGERTAVAQRLRPLGHGTSQCQRIARKHRFPLLPFLMAAGLLPWLHGMDALGATGGLVIYKDHSFDSDSMAEIENYRSVQHFPSVDNVHTTDGQTLRIFSGQEPIYIPEPGEPDSTAEETTATILAAERRYPQFTRKLEVVRRAWAALPAAAPPVQTTSATSAKSNSALTVDQWRKKAMEQFPELAVAGSPLNAAFVAKYKAYQGSNYFDSPDWPMRLAKECAGAIPWTNGVSQAAQSAPVAAPATDVLLTKSGRVFQAWSVTRIDGDAAIVNHADGISRVPIADFPDDLSKFPRDKIAAVQQFRERAVIKAIAEKRAAEAGAEAPTANNTTADQDVRNIGVPSIGETIKREDFSISNHEGDTVSAITAGPDGNIWFADNSGCSIGRMTPAGVITMFPIPTDKGYPCGITAGPDGNLWFTEPTKIGRITTAGIITEFPMPTNETEPFAITGGPDGNVWFTEESTMEQINKGIKAGKIGRITPAGNITEFPLPTDEFSPNGIAAGPDGNLWFTDRKIGKITTAGNITEFPVPTDASSPHAITTGPDGNLWFIEVSGRKIGRITPAGILTEFPIPTGDILNPRSINVGSDGNLWLAGANAAGSCIIRMTTAGSFKEYSVNRANNYWDKPDQLTDGPDGNLWVTWEGKNKITRFTIEKNAESPNLDATAAEKPVNAEELGADQEEHKRAEVKRVTQSVNIALSQVGDPGNAPDPTKAVDGTSGYGEVDYVYAIGTFDVTLSQYATFLNAVAVQSDPYGQPNWLRKLGLLLLIGAPCYAAAIGITFLGDKAIDLRSSLGAYRGEITTTLLIVSISALLCWAVLATARGVAAWKAHISPRVPIKEESAEWYYSEGENSVGPFTVGQLRDLQAAGVIEGQTFVCAAGGFEWLHYNSVFQKNAPLTGSDSDFSGSEPEPPPQDSVYPATRTSGPVGWLLIIDWTFSIRLFTTLLFIVVPVLWGPLYLWLAAFPLALMTWRFTPHRPFGKSNLARIANSIIHYFGYAVTGSLGLVIVLHYLLVELHSEEPAFMRSGVLGWELTDPLILNLKVHRYVVPIAVPSELKLDSEQAGACEKYGEIFYARDKVLVTGRLRLEKVHSSKDLIDVLGRMASSLTLVGNKMKDLDTETLRAFPDTNNFTTIENAIGSMNDDSSDKNSDEDVHFMNCLSEKVERFRSDSDVHRALERLSAGNRSREDAAPVNLGLSEVLEGTTAPQNPPLPEPGSIATYPAIEESLKSVQDRFADNLLSDKPISSKNNPEYTYLTIWGDHAIIGVYFRNDRVEMIYVEKKGGDISLQKIAEDMLRVFGDRFHFEQVSANLWVDSTANVQVVIQPNEVDLTTLYATQHPPK